MDTAKAVKKYGKVFRKILVMGSYPDPDVKQDSYETRLTKMYASEKYTEQEDLLLVTYVNNETFTEDDVFENEYRFEDDQTLIIKDSFGEEMNFVKDQD